MRIAAHGPRRPAVTRDWPVDWAIPLAASRCEMQIFYQAPYMRDMRFFAFTDARMPHPASHKITKAFLNAGNAEI